MEGGKGRAPKLLLNQGPSETCYATAYLNCCNRSNVMTLGSLCETMLCLASCVRISAQLFIYCIKNYFVVSVVYFLYVFRIIEYFLSSLSWLCWHNVRPWLLCDGIRAHSVACAFRDDTSPDPAVEHRT